MVEKKVMCIGCNDRDINMFMSCMTCRLSSHPGECTEFRHKYDIVIEMRILPWGRIVEM